MLQSVLQIGNSLGATFPKSFVVKNKITKNSKISVTHSDGSVTYSSHLPKSTQYEAISDKQLDESIREVEARYGNALDELAKLQ